MKPLVSVIIPMFNSENTIISTLKSVFNQTYENLELIIIDDGSTDESVDTVRNFLVNKVKFPFVLFKQKNKGPSSARNKGVELAKGKYIAFLDSDDKWLPRKTEIQIDYLEKHKELKMIGSLINNNFDDSNKKFKPVSYNVLLFKNFFLTPTVIVEKKIIREVNGFNINQKYSEDYYLWLKIARKYKSGIILSSLVICGDLKRTYGEKGLSSNLLRMEIGELSNYYRLFKNNLLHKNIFLNSILFLSSSIFSIIKFFKRVVITYLKF